MPATSAYKSLARTAAYLLVAVVLMIGGGAIAWKVMQTNVNKLDGKIDQLQQGDTPAAVNRRQDSAENRYILCSRSATVLDPEKVADLDKLCAGYDTLTHAYRSQNVPPRTR